MCSIRNTFPSALSGQIVFENLMQGPASLLTTASVSPEVSIVSPLWMRKEVDLETSEAWIDDMYKRVYKAMCY